MNVNDIITESHHACPHCGGPVVEYSDLMEKKDACYYKVKASAKVWPSAYASGRLVQCRKKGAANYGNKSEGVSEGFWDSVKAGWHGDVDFGLDDRKVYKVYINGKDVSSAMLSKAEAIEGVKELASEEVNSNTEYHIVNTRTKKIEGHYTAKQFYKESIKQGVAEAQLDEKCWDGYQQQGMKNKSGRQVPNCVPVEEDTDNKCPPATQDIELNLKNRQKAIDEYGYGPLNPDMPNAKFWMKKVDEWNLDSAEEAKQSLCGNCAAFDVRESTLDCIAQGIDSESPEDAAGVIDAGDLGYCKFLKFKCASRRTCDAWVTGGPLTDEQDAAESINETINPDCFDPAFNDTQIFDGLTYRATVEQEYGKPVLTIRVLDDNFQQAGLAKFKASKKGVTSLITSFRPEYQGQGLARNIYAYVRAMGNTIVPSRNQLPPGKAMWDSWKKSGEAKHLMTDVEEGWKDRVAGAALAGAVALGGAGEAQAGNDSTNAAWRNLPDIVAHITMTVNNKTIEKEINLGTQYQSPMAAKQAVTKWLEEKGVKNYTINLERVRSVDEDIAMTENQDELARILELGGIQLTEQLSADQQFDIIEDMVLELAEAHGVDAEQIWEDFESVDDHELFETAAWRRKEGKSKSGGLNAKGVASYRRENPGSKLQTAVTTKPSKLKPGSKAAKRRKSFCARMGGVKGPMKKPNGKPTRKALALRKWNC